MKIEIPGKRKVNNEMLPQIIERIFSVCKADPNFPMREKIEAVEDTLGRLDSKIKRQEELFLKGLEMKKKVSREIGILSSSNIETKERLIESLGSEL